MNQKFIAAEENFARELAMVFFRFMGVSGWLVLLLIITSGVAFMPSQFGGHDILYFQWILAVTIWLLSRWGTTLKDRYRQSKA
jgi:hypothetical protein